MVLHSGQIKKEALQGRHLSGSEGADASGLDVAFAD